jgi:tetratricopeptide (TPR) repeat protein
MPGTLNGIGTMYYGSKNASARVDACEFCRKVTTLQSYDTRLWFVVVFVPVIPLGRKRIFDQCNICNKHRAMSARAYETLKQLWVSESIDRFVREPSPQMALEAHATILSLGDLDRAAEVRKDALSQFPNHVGLLAGMASHLEEVSARDESAKLYEAALELQPDMPGARAGVAVRRISEGRLDEARSLLDFLEIAGAGKEHSLEPLNMLAARLQEHGRHAEALELAGQLLRENPALGQQHAFRKFVQKSEKARGGGESILPPRKHSLLGFLGGSGDRYPSWQRTLFLGGLGAALVLGPLGITNEYIRRHRTLFVANACGQPMQVQVDDGSPQTVSDLGRLVVSEGHHRVKMSGPVADTQEIDVQAGYFQRWLSKPVWVLNPGLEAVFEEDTLYYAEHPRPHPEGRRLIMGQPLVVRSHIDYAFEPAPDKLNVKGKNAELAKTTIKWLHGEDTRAFLEMVDGNRASALAFAESRLRRHPDDNGLLKAYLSNVGQSDFPRVTALLKAELARRPVVVPWHRTYQVMSELDPHNNMQTLYDGFLKAEPSNGALLYLRGRLELDADRQDELYRKSMAANPRLPWPWMALGIRAQADGRWDESLKDLLKARELKIDDDDIGADLQTARLATGQAKAMVKEYKTSLASRPFDLDAMVFLCEALAVAGETDKIIPELNAWEKLVRNSIPLELIAQLRAIALYFAGKLEECNDHCRRNPGLGSSALRAQSLLALKRSGEVISDKSFESLLNDPWVELAVSLAVSLENQPKEAARWRERAIPKLNSSFEQNRKVAKVMSAAEPPSDRDVARIYVAPELKALVYAILAERFPATRADYLAAAARYDVRRNAPYQLVRRAIEAGDKK